MADSIFDLIPQPPQGNGTPINPASWFTQSLGRAAMQGVEPVTADAIRAARMNAAKNAVFGQGMPTQANTGYVRPAGPVKSAAELGYQAENALLVPAAATAGALFGGPLGAGLAAAPAEGLRRNIAVATGHEQPRGYLSNIGGELLQGGIGGALAAPGEGLAALGERAPMFFQRAASGGKLPAQLLKRFPQFNPEAVIGRDAMGNEIMGNPENLYKYMLDQGIPMGNGSRGDFRQVGRQATDTADQMIADAEGKIIPGVRTFPRTQFVPQQAQVPMPNGSVTMQTGNVGTTLQFPAMDAESMAPGPGMMPVPFPRTNVAATAQTPIPVTRTLQLPDQMVNQTILAPTAGTASAPNMIPASNVTAREIADLALKRPGVTAGRMLPGGEEDAAQVQQIINDWADQNPGRIGLDKLNQMKRDGATRIRQMYEQGATATNRGVAVSAPNMNNATKSVTDVARDVLEDHVPGLREQNQRIAYAMAARNLNNARSNIAPPQFSWRSPESWLLGAAGFKMGGPVGAGAALLARPLEWQLLESPAALSRMAQASRGLATPMGQQLIKGGTPGILYGVGSFARPSPQAPILMHPAGELPPGSPMPDSSAVHTPTSIFDLPASNDSTQVPQ